VHAGAGSAGDISGMYNDGSILFKKQSNIVHDIRKRKANWIGHILRRNCLL